MRFLYIFLLVICTSIFLSCGEEESDNMYNSEVFFEVDVRSIGPDNNLNSTGNYKIFERPRLAKDRGVGFGGLLIVCSGDILEGTAFYHLFAYDLACPHERRADIKVEPQSDGKVKCPECGSEFSLYGGNPLSGPSKKNLVRYQARPNNQTPGVFTITR